MCYFVSRDFFSFFSTLTPLCEVTSGFKLNNFIVSDILDHKPKNSKYSTYDPSILIKFLY